MPFPLYTNMAFDLRFCPIVLRKERPARKASAAARNARGFLNRVSQVRFLPRAPPAVVLRVMLDGERVDGVRVVTRFRNDLSEERLPNLSLQPDHLRVERVDPRYRIGSDTTCP
jgi:hypothetical protein